MSKLNWEKANRAETWAGRQRQKKQSLLQKLQAANEQGAKRERLRIIKLLENFIEVDPVNSQEEHTIKAIRYLLPFIKGEQK